jgi:hypothetical protein
MDVPFNASKYHDDKLNSDIERFQELFQKYKGCINEVLEFARLWNRLTANAEYKWTED